MVKLSFWRYVISRLLSAFAFIYIQFSCSATNMPAWAQPLNPKIAIYSLWQPFQEFRHLPLIKPSAWRGQLCFRDSKASLFTRNIILPLKSFLVWNWRYLNLCNTQTNISYYFCFWEVL